MGPPVAAPPDTVPQIVGWYSGYSIFDEYEYNTRQSFYLILTIESVGDTVTGCLRTFVLILDNGNGTPEVINASGDPRTPTWDCSDKTYHTKFSGIADGRSITGSLYQYRKGQYGGETLSYIVTFNARKP